MFLRLIILGLLINRTDVHGWLVGHSRGSGIAGAGQPHWEQGNHKGCPYVGIPYVWGFFTIPLCVEMALIERAFNRE